MAHNPFLRGVGLGMLAGAVVGMVVSPGKKELKQTANKAVQAVGNAADMLSDAIGQ
jgi:gas vesicle protein